MDDFLIISLPSEALGIISLYLSTKDMINFRCTCIYLSSRRVTYWLSRNQKFRKIHTNSSMVDSFIPCKCISCYSIICDEIGYNQAIKLKVVRADQLVPFQYLADRYPEEYSDIDNIISMAIAHGAVSITKHLLPFIENDEQQIKRLQKVCIQKNFDFGCFKSLSVYQNPIDAFFDVINNDINSFPKTYTIMSYMVEFCENCPDIKSHFSQLLNRTISIGRADLVQCLFEYVKYQDDPSYILASLDEKYEISRGLCYYSRLRDILPYLPFEYFKELIIIYKTNIWPIITHSDKFLNSLIIRPKQVSFKNNNQHVKYLFSIGMPIKLVTNKILRTCKYTSNQDLLDFFKSLGVSIKSNFYKFGL
jgi:hypothetical protein